MREETVSPEKNDSINIGGEDNRVIEEKYLTNSLAEDPSMICAYWPKDMPEQNEFNNNREKKEE